MNPSSTKKVYLLDTNILVGFSIWLPIKSNGIFWSKLAQALEDGKWILLDVVMKEVKYDAELVKWCKAQQAKSLVTPIADEHRNRAVEINALYKMIDATTQKSTVDTYLIAYAEANKLVVFSRESARKNSTELYKIPDVCKALNLQRISMPEHFLSAIGYTNN